MLAMGERAEFKKVRESGRNSLDLYLACCLGMKIKEHPDSEFTIVSKDKGYDRLIRQVKKDEGVRIKRVEIGEEDSKD